MKLTYKRPSGLPCPLQADPLTPQRYELPSVHTTSSRRCMLERDMMIYILKFLYLERVISCDTYRYITLSILTVQRALVVISTEAYRMTFSTYMAIRGRAHAEY